MSAEEYRIPCEGDSPTSKEIARECARIASENGFQRPNWETNFVHKAAYVITELVEGVEFLHGEGEDPIEEELADAAIRIMDLLEGLWDWCSRVESRRLRPGENHSFAPPEVIVWPIIRRLSKTLEAYRHDNQREAQQYLELALLDTFRAADRIGCDLVEEIRIKCMKNMQRAKLHGKVRSEG